MATILIVDDQTANRELVGTLVRYAGHTALEATDGSEALEMVRKMRPDLVVCDLLMPVMDGYEFRTEQKKIDRLQHIPVVVMTGDSDAGMDQNMLHPLGVLIKPLQIQSVINSITMYLNPTGI